MYRTFSYYFFSHFASLDSSYWSLLFDEFSLAEDKDLAQNGDGID